jgi:hypothetical protein
VVQWCESHGVTFTITADHTAPLLETIGGVPERSGRPLPESTLSEGAEVRYQPTGGEPPYRSVLNRELAEQANGELYWKSQVVVTTDEGRTASAVMMGQLQHADRENALKEHKSGFGLEKLPTQKFQANWAYLLIGQVAVNLVAWCKRLVLPSSCQRMTLKTLRHRLLNLAGKLVRTARRCFLMISDHYRYQEVWRFAIRRLVHLQFG